VLALPPDELLGYQEPAGLAGPAGDALDERRGRLAAFVTVMQALAATPALRGTASGPGESGKAASLGQFAAVSPGPPGRARPRRPEGIASAVT